MRFLKNIQKNNSKSFQAGLLFLTIGSVLFLFLRVSKVAERPEVLDLAETTPTSPRLSKVTAVYDGDTIGIETGEKIRYIGVDAPEIENQECFAAEAAKFNESLVIGKTVKLVSDVSETDKYGRLLRYVYVIDEVEESQEVFVNDYLMKSGYAKVMTVSPDMKFAEQFALSEKYAKDNNLGLWEKCTN